MAELYSISGREDWFEFEQLSSVKPVTAKADGLIQGVTGGSINWDFYSDTKVSGSLEVSDTPMLHSKYVRVYYVSRIPVMVANSGLTTYQKKRALLATCYADTSKGHLENGKYSGTITLKSPLTRLTEDKLSKNITLSKDNWIVPFIQKITTWYGGSYQITGLKDRKVMKTHVWDFGTTVYDMFEETASWVGGYVTMDLQGRICIRGYTAPSKRNVDYTIPIGQESVVFPGIDITSTLGSAISRVAIKYVKTEKYQEKNAQNRNVTKTRQIPIFGLAALPSSNPASREQTGKLVTYTETVNTLNPETQAQANKIAANTLAKQSGYVTEYQFKSYYMPIWCNEMVHFRYENINVDALVTAIDYDLSVGCPMTVTLRKIRNHKK